MKQKLIISLIFITSLAGTARALTVDDIISGESQGQVLGASTNGLVGYWNFDEGSGTTASDSSGNNNNGTITGATWSVNPPAGGGSGALDFNGSSSYVEIPYNSSLNPSQFTVSAWVYFTGGSGYRAVFSSRVGISRQGYIIYVNNSNVWEFWTGSGTNWDVIAASGVAVSPNTWTHVAASYDGSAAKIYINGVQRGSGIRTYVPQTSRPALVGAGGNEGNPPYLFQFLGKIDEVRVYSRALSAQEITDVYNDTGSTPPVNPPPAGDSTPPVISAVSSSAVSQSAATISWTTDEASDTQVEYGSTISYGFASTLNSSLVTTHSVSLSSLSASTLYHYRVKSKDSAGNLAVSSDNTFTTATPVSTGPATYTAASCSQSDVQAAINQQLVSPVDGDIISIPAGTCTWTGTTHVSAAFKTSVTIQGAGAVSATDGGTSTTGSDLTTIIDNLNHDVASSYGVFFLNVIPGKSFRFTGITILQNTSSVPRANTGMLTVNSTTLRIDHSHLIVRSGGVGIRINGSSTGVIDHMYFESPAGSVTNAVAIHNASSYGDASWADTDHFGSSQFLFVEDSRFYNGGVGDANGGARYVLRHNTVIANTTSNIEGQMFNHGLTSSRYRGARAAEVYNNTFSQLNPLGGGNPTYSFNSGTLLYWGNTVDRYRAAVLASYTRKDNTTYPYGTPPTGWGNCNGTSLYTNWDGPTPGGYPCMDQPARGKGDLLTGSVPNVVNSRTGTIASPQQERVPAYLWMNTYTHPYAGAALFRYDSNQLTPNSDFYTDAAGFNGTAGTGYGLLSARPTTCTAGPGGNTPGVGYWATDQNTFYTCTTANIWTTYYTPYVYPHPLVSGSAPPSDPIPPVTPPADLTPPAVPTGILVK